MVTDAVWMDYNGDGGNDLMLVGEWMPITIFLNNKGNFSEKVTIPNSEGWWLHITPNDLDSDGDMDFVLGNWGLNSKFKANQDHPMTLYVKDFDNNGKSEFVINWKPPADDKTYPFPSKMDLTNQMPGLKKRILKYKEYAKMDYEALFTSQEKQGTIKRKASRMETAVLKNIDGQFVLENLPLAAQLTPQFTSIVEDINKDGIKDIWLGGNFYGLKPEVGRHNDSRGILLLGKENGTYEEANQLIPSIEGEIRDVDIIQTVKGDQLLLIAVNDKEMGVLQIVNE